MTASQAESKRMNRLGKPQSNPRLLWSLAALVVLALLSWRTMEPGQAQKLTWLLLGFFAFRIVLSWFRSRRIEEERALPLERRI